jgi:hypothetical protein
MKTFRDTAGREWAIAVDVGAIKRVMKAPIEYCGEPLKVNLLGLVEPDGELLRKVVDYPPLLADILYALCKPQCDEKGIGDEDFGRALGGDVLDQVVGLLLEETVDFFPHSRRTLLRKFLEKSQTFAQKAKDLTAARLATGEIDAALDALLAAELDKMRGPAQAPPTIGTGTAGSSPALSGSTPNGGPLPS